MYLGVVDVLVKHPFSDCSTFNQPLASCFLSSVVDKWVTKTVIGNLLFFVFVRL